MKHPVEPDMGGVDSDCDSIKKRSWAPVIRPGKLNYPDKPVTGGTDNPQGGFGGSRGRTGRDDVKSPEK